MLGMEAWKRWAAKLQLDATAPVSLDHRAAGGAVLKRIAALTRSFPYYARPRAVALSLQPWTPENGLMTPTLKLKRNNLAQEFTPRIDPLCQRLT